MGRTNWSGMKKTVERGVSTMVREGSRSFPHIGKLQESLGIELISMSNGKCSVGVKVDECHLNKGGVAHGGLHATLLDTAMGGATVSSLSEEEWCATVQLDISYLNAAKVNSGLICTGTVLRRGRSIAHVQGEIRDQEERVIAIGKGTWGIWNGRPKHLR